MIPRLLLATFLVLTIGVSYTFAGFGDRQSFDLTILFGQPSALKVPMVNGLFLVPVKVNGQDPVYFLLDTGAALSVIDVNAAKTLTVQRGDDPMTLVGAGGAAQSHAEIASNVRLEFNGETVVNARLGVVPLNILSESKYPCVGILGFDILKHSIIKLDYRNSTVEFIDPATFTDTQQIQVPLTMSYNTSNVEVSLSSGGVMFSTRLELDTGSGGGLQLSPGFMEQNPNFRMIETGTGVGRGLGGTAGFIVGRSPEIKLGDYIMHDQPVQLLSACPTPNGLLGAEILAQFDVTIDVPDNLLLLRPNGLKLRPDPVAPPPPEQDAEGGGMEVKVTDKGYEVISVLPGSQGQRAGVHKGDVLVALDQKEIGNMDIAKLQKLLAFPVKWFGVTRDGDSMQMRVKD